MNRKFYYVFCLICITAIILVSGCSLSKTENVPQDTNGGKSVSSDMNGGKTQDNLTQDKLTLEGIKQSYANTGEKIICTKEYENYVVVESQPSDSPGVLTLYNLKTGDKDVLPGNGYRIDFQKINIVDENHIVLYTEGNNYINGYQAFPFEIDCQRGSENTSLDNDFIPYYKDVKLPIAKQISLRGKNTKEEITDIRVTVNGLQVCFGPQSSDDMNFGAAYVDCPGTDISYDKASGEFTLKFKDTRIAKSYTDNSPKSYSNSYIKSINLKENGDSAAIIIKLNDLAKYYTGKKSEVDYDVQNSLGIPYMDIQFFNSNMEF